MLLWRFLAAFCLSAEREVLPTVSDPDLPALRVIVEIASPSIAAVRAIPDTQVFAECGGFAVVIEGAKLELRYTFPDREM